MGFKNESRFLVSQKRKNPQKSEFYPFRSCSTIVFIFLLSIKSDFFKLFPIF